MGDVTVEFNDSLELKITEIKNASKGDTVGLGIINNDDVADATNTFISISDATNTEGKNFTFIVRLNQISADTVYYIYRTFDLTATLNIDLKTQFGNRKIAPGKTTDTIKIATSEDRLDELDETFRVLLSNVQNSNIMDAEGIGIIVDDDPAPVLTIRDASLNEGDAGKTSLNFEFSLDRPSAYPVRVTYSTSDSTAKVSDSDYISVNAVLIFPVNDTLEQVKIGIIGDIVYEKTEFLKLYLEELTNATATDSLAIGTITNDDNLPVLSVSDVKIDEGDAGTKDMKFRITLDRISTENVSFEYRTVNVGSASPGVDYIKVDATPDTIFAGAISRVIKVDIVGDVTVEFNDSLELKITEIKNASKGDTVGLGIINNDDVADATNTFISISDATNTEGKNFTFIVRLNQISADTVHYSYRTFDLTATLDIDLKTQFGNRKIAPGKTTDTIKIVTSEDRSDEPDETFRVLLSNVQNSNIIDKEGIGIIVDDDPMPKPNHQ